MPNELLTLGAAELAARIRSKAVSPVEVVEAHIARIEAVNPRINAVVTPMFESARAQARAAEAYLATGTDDLPPLFGVPVTIKDALAVEGVRFTAGSWFMRDNVAGHDAEAVRRFKAAGAILLGKTNCPDMSWVAETENPIFGLTRNPWNLRRSAGGSSGGEAAIIAAGGSPLGLGSDIAGSIRLPAAMCGTVGLKPTARRVSTAGHVPEAPPALDGWNTIGPLARRVDDLALALRVLSETPVHDYRETPLAGRPGAVFTSAPLQPTRGVVREVLAQAVGALRALGMNLAQRDDLPLGDMALAYAAIMQREGEQAIRMALGGGEPLRIRRELGHTLRGQKRVSSKALYIVAEVNIGRFFGWRGYGKAENVERWRAQVLEAMGPGGVLLLPVFALPAPRHGFTYGFYSLPGYTLVINLLGLPAVSVPVGRTRHGLPINVQVVAHPGQDETALAVAAALERIFGGWQMAAG